MGILFHDNFRPEVVSDVVSGPDVDQVGVDATVKFGDFRLNGSRDIGLPHVVTDE